MSFTRILTGISFIVAFVFLIIIFISGIVLYDSDSTNSKISGSQINNNSFVSSGISLILDSTEISKHNNRNDCWLLINNKVYDVTSFISMHPANPRTILDNCGKESTQQFSSRGGTGSHSSTAVGLLSFYYIGDLGQTIGAIELQNKTSAVQNVSVPPIRVDDDWDDD